MGRQYSARPFTRHRLLNLPPPRVLETRLSVMPFIFGIISNYASEEYRTIYKNKHIKECRQMEKVEVRVRSKVISQTDKPSYEIMEGGGNDNKARCARTTNMRVMAMSEWKAFSRWSDNDGGSQENEF